MLITDGLYETPIAAAACAGEAMSGRAHHVAAIIRKVREEHPLSRDVAQT